MHLANKLDSVNFHPLAPWSFFASKSSSLNGLDYFFTWKFSVFTLKLIIFSMSE